MLPVASTLLQELCRPSSVAHCCTLLRVLPLLMWDRFPLLDSLWFVGVLVRGAQIFRLAPFSSRSSVVSILFDTGVACQIWLCIGPWLLGCLLELWAPAGGGLLRLNFCLGIFGSWSIRLLHPRPRTDFGGSLSSELLPYIPFLRQSALGFSVSTPLVGSIGDVGLRRDLLERFEQCSTLSPGFCHIGDFSRFVVEDRGSGER